jgi:hypothetical protein
MIIRSARSPVELARMRDSVAIVGRLSDSLVRLGPLRLGLDGVLSWIPGLGEIYSAAAAAFIIIQGFRAGVPLHILVFCALLMASRTTVSAIPLVGPAAADLFTAHRWSAKLVAQAIDTQLPVRARSGGVPAFATA